ncbi:hypothetical protein [Paenibacillus sp. B2(2019)]|uniref:hypothetical protein n=1 Tax=Paenibacillus sp. B2(2019) TaxID=2607754 RepID=UPI001CB7430F|nr:hypothetical protein [Paenibacillus sp. B2(2019)]
MIHSHDIPKVNEEDERIYAVQGVAGFVYDAAITDYEFSHTTKEKIFKVSNYGLIHEQLLSHFGSSSSLYRVKGGETA